MSVTQQRAFVFRNSKLRVLAAIFEAVSERVHGRTFAHSCSTAYMAWLEATRTPWTPHFMEAAVPSVSCDQPGTTNAVGRSHV